MPPMGVLIIAIVIAAVVVFGAGSIICASIYSSMLSEREGSRNADGK